MDRFKKTGGFYDYDFKDYSDKVIDDIDNINSYKELCETQEFYEQINSDICNNKVNYIIRKSADKTYVDVTTSSGHKISELTLDGNYDTVPEQLKEILLADYKTHLEKVLWVLHLKISWVEQRKELIRPYKVASCAIIALCLLYMAFIILHWYI